MVIRSGGDAGTVTHTSVPSEIVATIPSALPVWADIGLGAEPGDGFSEEPMPAPTASSGSELLNA